jgi:hypothetical protein
MFVPAILSVLLAGCSPFQSISSCDTGDPVEKCVPPIDTGDTDDTDTGGPDTGGPDTGGPDPVELPVGAHARWQRACGPADGAAMELVVGLAEPTCEALHAAPTLRVMVIDDVALTGTWAIGPDLADPAFAQWQSADDVDGFASATDGTLTVEAGAAGGFSATGQASFGDLGVVLLDGLSVLDCTAEQPICG